MMDSMIKNWDRLLPIAFYYDHLSAEEQKQITQQLNEFYFKNEPFLESNRENLTKVKWFFKNVFTLTFLSQLWSDAYFNGMIESLKIRLQSSQRENTFVYLFSHKGSASYSEISGGGPDKFYGSAHGDTLLRLFPEQKTIPELFGSIPSNDDQEVTKMMTKLWVNFATTG